jgi:hypothetical protein
MLATHIALAWRTRIKLSFGPGVPDADIQKVLFLRLGDVAFICHCHNSVIVIP